MTDDEYRKLLDGRRAQARAETGKPQPAFRPAEKPPPKVLVEGNIIPAVRAVCRRCGCKFDWPGYEQPPPPYCIECKRWICTAERRDETCGVGQLHRKFELDDRCKPASWAIEHVLGHGGLLILCGPRGCGKTQILSTSVLTTIWRGDAAEYRHAIDLMAELKEAWDRGENDVDWLDYCSVPYLLCIDEVTELGDNQNMRRMFQRLIDRRYSDRRSTILAGNFEPREAVSVLGAAIADRARETGGIIHCSWESFRERAACRPAAPNGKLY